MKAWLGLGSNLQRPALQVGEAIKQLAASNGIDVLRTSSLYRTPPWGDEQQDDFVNAVVQIETRLDPLELLARLQSIEKTMGRSRGARRWGPRIIDIDVLLYGNQQYKSDVLEVPHARMHERAFVLMPLVELEPGLEIPGLGVAQTLLDDLDCSGINRLGQDG